MGKDIWKSYFKFTFIRNPYEIQVSRYFWNKKGKDKTKKTSIEDFRNWIKNNNLLETDLLWQYFSGGVWSGQTLTPGGGVGVDYVGRYETLKDDYEQICKN